MSITIPTLRTKTLVSPETVPVGETWVIKEWYSTAGFVTINASGVSYLFSESVGAWTNQTNLSRIMGRKCPVLKAGDTITGGAGDTIYYWILESDFGIASSLIPAYRAGSQSDTIGPFVAVTTYNPADSVTNTINITVPVGEFWYIPLANVNFASTALGTTLLDGSLDLTQRITFYREGTTFVQALFTRSRTGGGTWPSYSTDYQLLPYIWILKPGDKIEIQHSLIFGTNTAWTSGSLQTDIALKFAYWKLEEDL